MTIDRKAIGRKTIGRRLLVENRLLVEKTIDRNDNWSKIFFKYFQTKLITISLKLTIKYKF